MGGILFSIFWFILLYFGTFFFNKNKDLFSPIKLICLLNIFRNVTYLINLYFDNSIFFENIPIYLGLTLDEAVIKYTLVQTLAFSSLILGISIFKTKKGVSNLSQNIYHYKSLVVTSNICFCLGFISYLIFLSNVGGIVFLLSNLNNRVELQSGSFISILTPLMSLAVILRVKVLSIKKTNWNKVLLYIFLFITIIANSTKGGRKTTVFLILMVFVSYHYYIRNISLTTIKYLRILLVSIAIGFYAFIIPILRAPDGLENLLSGNAEISENIDTTEILSYFSYTYIDIFCANYFNDKNKWNFSTLYTIPSAFDRTISSKLKPPIDEGVYFYNIAKYNNYFSPPTSRSKMVLVSLPIENFGFGYANFLIPGVIISFFLLGMVYKKVYNIYLKSSLNPFFLFLYFDVVFNFNFSSLRLVSLLFLLVNILLGYLIYYINNLKKI